MPMRIIINNMAIIIVFRIHGIWLFNLTISHNLYNGVQRMSRFTYPFAFVLVTLLILGCNGNPVASKPGDVLGVGPYGQVLLIHPTACIADSLIKRLETYTLKISDNSRARCHVIDSGYADNGAFFESVECKAKSPDTLYTIDTFCNGGK